MVKLDIVLITDNDRGKQIYRPGSVVEGYVALEFSSPQNTKGISIVISGKARVKWTGRLTRTNEPGNPCDTEIVLSAISRQLLGNGRDSQRLAAGRYELPFSFQLPTGLPSSFYCNVVADFCWNVTSKGYIRYSQLLWYDHGKPT